MSDWDIFKNRIEILLSNEGFSPEQLQRMDGGSSAYGCGSWDRAAQELVAEKRARRFDDPASDGYLYARYEYDGNLIHWKLKGARVRKANAEKGILAGNGKCEGRKTTCHFGNVKHFTNG